MYLGSAMSVPSAAVGTHTEPCPLAIKKPTLPTPAGNTSVRVMAVGKACTSAHVRNTCRSRSGGGTLPALAGYHPNIFRYVEPPLEMVVKVSWQLGSNVSWLMVASRIALIDPAIPPSAISPRSRQAWTLSPVSQPAVGVEIFGTTVPSGCVTSAKATRAHNADASASRMRQRASQRGIIASRPGADAVEARRQGFDGGVASQARIDLVAAVGCRFALLNAVAGVADAGVIDRQIAKAVRPAGRQRSRGVVALVDRADHTRLAAKRRGQSGARDIGQRQAGTGARIGAGVRPVGAMRSQRVADRRRVDALRATRITFAPGGAIDVLRTGWNARCAHDVAQCIGQHRAGDVGSATAFGGALGRGRRRRSAELARLNAPRVRGTGGVRSHVDAHAPEWR